VRVFGNHFVLLENAETNQSNQHIGEAILKADLPFISEVIATEVEICLKLKGTFRKEYLESIAEIESVRNEKSDTYVIPVNFDQSLDWDLVELACSIDKQEYIQNLLKLEFDIAMFGFLPGFIYMNGLPQTMHVPRKSNPEIGVQANSLAIGEKYLGFYSLPSPGGWNVIGKSPIRLMQTDKLPPIMVPASAKFRLKSISNTEYNLLLDQDLNIIEYNGLA